MSKFEAQKKMHDLLSGTLKKISDGIYEYKGEWSDGAVAEQLDRNRNAVRAFRVLYFGQLKRPPEKIKKFRTPMRVDHDLMKSLEDRVSRLERILYIKDVSVVRNNTMPLDIDEEEQRL